VPTVAQFSTVQFQLSLGTDPLTGPYTTSLSTFVGMSVTIRVSQVTAGPAANVSISFGDGSAAQQFYVASSWVNVSYSFTASGTYTISATGTLVGLSITPTINTMTVVVATPPIYSCLFFFFSY
jgi:hypothetical protein